MVGALGSVLYSSEAGEWPGWSEAGVRLFRNILHLGPDSLNFPCCRAEFYPKKQMPSYQENQLILAKSLTEQGTWEFHADPNLYCLGDLVHSPLSGLARLPCSPMEQGTLITQVPPSSALGQNSGISKSDVRKAMVV